VSLLFTEDYDGDP